MKYPGLFSAQLALPPHQFERNLRRAVGDELAKDRRMLSIIANTVSTRHGGIAANICYGMAQLAIHPTLVSAVGSDCDPYLEQLEKIGIDTRCVRVFGGECTPRFDCVTDEDHNQIATFYEESSVHQVELSLSESVERVGGAELVLITSAETKAMLRHTAEARALGLPFVADPSQRLRQGLLSREQLHDLIDGAAYLIHNTFERRLLEETTGWSSEDVLHRVGCRITTMAAGGAVVETADTRVEVTAAVARHPVDLTGVGDAFRSGFFGGLLHGLSLEHSARLGCVMSACVLDVVGTQEYWADADELIKRWRESYEDGSAEKISRVVFG